MIAVFINALVIIVSSILGRFIGNKTKKVLQDEVLFSLGISVIALGISLTLKSNNFVLMIISIMLGIMIGDFFDFESKINSFGTFLKSFLKTKNTESQFIDGFVLASIIYCSGSMSIIGSIAAGIEKDYSILLTKSLLDGITAIIFTSTAGIGVAFSSITVFIYEGMLTMFAIFLKDFFTVPLLNDISAVGGLMLLILGFDMMGIKKLRTANIFPAIFIPMIYHLLVNIL